MCRTCTSSSSRKSNPASGVPSGAEGKTVAATDADADADAGPDVDPTAGGAAGVVDVPLGPPVAVADGPVSGAKDADGVAVPLPQAATIRMNTRSRRTDTASAIRREASCRYRLQRHEVVDVPENLRIVSFGGHPADTFDQSAGTMAHHAAQGDYVAAVAVTHGARIHDKKVSDEMFHVEAVPEATQLQDLIGERGDVKADEVRRACRILGFEDVFFLDAPASPLMVEGTTIRRMASLIRQLRPDIILTHFPFEHAGLGDHAITGQMVVRAIDYAAGVDPGDRNPPVRVEQVFFFGQGGASVRNGLWDAAGGYTNDVFIDITDVIDKKFQAMECLVSQGYAGAYNRKRTENGDGAFGGGHVAYGEGFIRMNSEVHYTLPLSPYARERGRLSDHEIMARYSWRLPGLDTDTLEGRPTSLVPGR
jgi:LmbE family N-acetylglucosaminyl deacetylase